MKTQLQHLCLLVFSLIVLSGCGAGASGDNEVTTNPTIGAKIEVDVLNSDGQEISTIEATNTVIVRARATNDFGRGVADIAITFSSTIGTLPQDSALTDANGYASVNLTTISSQLGVAVITAEGTVDSKALVASGQVEFTALSGQNPATLTLLTYDQQCQQPINETAVGNSLCLKATLKQDGIPINDQVVEFAANLGTLSPSSALTDETGTATVFLLSNATDRGAGTVTATANSQSTSQNYQFVAAQGSLTLTVNTYAEDCTTSRNSFPAGATVCLAATLFDNDTPLDNQIISFEFPLGTLRQTTALTDEQGVAAVLADSTADLLGAATASATFDTIQSSSNYEFVSDNTLPGAGPQLSLATLQNNVFKNRFKAGEASQLQATLIDSNGQPMENTIINFTAERGLLSTNAALTDPSGIAQVILTGETNNIGAAVATAQVTISGVPYTQSFNYEILPADAVELDEAMIGYFDQDGQFVPQKIGASIQRCPDPENPVDNCPEGAIPLSAGGTVGLNVVVVNQAFERITSPTPVTFASACESNGQTNLDTQVTTINGEARSTYEDLSCATVEGNQDDIVATITVNNVSLTASATIALQPESVGSIEFISAEPANIVLQGTGGQGKQETSTLTFQVKGVLGNPLTQQEVTFSLDSGVGDLTISPTDSLTNSQGLVSTRVTSGHVPAAVRVTASTVVSEGEDQRTISTQSDLLSVNTGLPDQNSITLSTELFNPEANALNGKEVIIHAYMADSFNNPVPNGTTINFTTEGGFIQPSCNTVNGSCQVNWTAANPRVPNHRITVLATAIGHETFFDVNGNNVFDESDGGALNQGTDSGFGRGNYASAGFVDHSEAWRDDDEDRVHDEGEIFIDFDNDNTFDGADGLFNGPQCTHNSLCGDEAHAKINVRKALVMIMSGSTIRYSLLTGNLNPGNNTSLEHIGTRHVIISNDSGNNVTVDGMISVLNTGTSSNNSNQLVIAEGLSLPMQLVIADDAAGLGQILPAGTSVTITTSVGRIAGQTAFSVPNSVGYLNTTGVDEYGGNEISFSLVNTNDPTTTGDASLEGLITITITLPDSGHGYAITAPVNMIGN